ncbi:Aspartyl aminopeptidase 4 [Candida viswanathii]|uniref:aspartyl aminopeptidase n=1 Tax=Candida viswanathii TaxID=5486 RepID=A0A367YF50_9ASCO|nr:Aspartyl aminopeptidase 4 [Candida viswanathii]
MSTATPNTTRALEYAQGFVDFVNASPTPYHAVDSVKCLLKDAGFEELVERHNWEQTASLKKGGKYYVTRNGSSLIAFTIGGKFANGNGIAIVGAHTDSPCLRIKPISKKNAEGFIQVGVEQYGGLIAHSWFDRDLSVAGRVYVQEGDQYVPRLLKVDKPLLRISTLAIHLDREVNTKFEFNKETKLVPIAGQVSVDKNESAPKTCADDPALKMTPEEFESVQSVVTRHSESLVQLIAKELDVTPQQIEDFELVLFDHQKSVLGGLNDEFIFSARLDNLVSCFTAARAIVDSASAVNDNAGISLISLFDHEEIGSRSAQGADSTFLPDVLQRLTRVDFDGQGSAGNYFHETMAKSFLLSSDMAHGVHPNYSDKYEAQNRPQLNMGPVIKINANQRYATNSPGIVLLKKVANIAQVPLQLFVVRNDSPCGSTIGPILAAKLGIRTLDLGNPQLSMHSIRETGGTFDIARLTDLFRSYFENYTDVDARILCDHL